MWYDGTSISGGISFDRGLGSHNQDIYGSNGKRRSSLFFNYNWGSNRNANLMADMPKKSEVNLQHEPSVTDSWMAGFCGPLPK